MAVYTTPRAPARDSFICIICFCRVSALDVTTGSLSNDGRQAFACNQHLYNRRAWINAWAQFEVQAQDTAKRHDLSATAKTAHPEQMR